MTAPAPNFIRAGLVRRTPPERVFFGSIQEVCRKCNAPVWISPSVLLTCSTYPQFLDRILCDPCADSFMCAWMERMLPIVLKEWPREKKERFLAELERWKERTK